MIIIVIILIRIHEPGVPALHHSVLLAEAGHGEKAVFSRIFAGNCLSIGPSPKCNSGALVRFMIWLQDYLSSRSANAWTLSI